VTGRGLVDALLSALLAPPCAACDRVLDRPLDGAVCATCWSRITFISPPVCDGCGDPLPSWRVASCAAGICARCRRLRPAVDRMRAIGPYQGELRAIVHALKYDGRRSIAPKLGELMRMGGRDILAGADAVVPVPLHPRRRRQRGFNQAALLASHLGLPVQEVLRRIIYTRPQVELPAARRHRNVREAVQVIAGGAKAPLLPIETKTLVLVDDVITTGATLGACARALKAAGAREVRALTAARVVSGPPQGSGP
jgi:ComF family protein